ncbi:MAG: aspartyl-phosphate phosphatase Spo0E family protein [Dethiobacter sp.]|nr:aspartyl-phosphate phosphatase Spo0E family protein [Dethiobacter sp.]MBS3898691.1 aspartyl-phosphate phosphatase Spo0E family protein [Dethiobacter sp.]
MLELTLLIERERDTMHRLAAEHGLGDERTIRQSQRLGCWPRSDPR